MVQILRAFKAIREYLKAQRWAKSKIVCLLKLHPNQWMYGLEIMEHTGLSLGSIYPQLMRLEKEGVVESCWEDEGDTPPSSTKTVQARAGYRRRYYRIREHNGTVKTDSNKLGKR